MPKVFHEDGSRSPLFENVRPLKGAARQHLSGLCASTDVMGANGALAIQPQSGGATPANIVIFVDVATDARNPST